MATGSQKNPERQAFVSRDDIDKAMAVSSLDWKLIIAFARYGGVRVPSELMRLAWEHVDFAAGKILIYSSKTEHHLGKDKRLIPMFPELRALLEQAFNERESGASLVITRRLDRGSNLRTQFQRILKRAGVKPWPKLFQNLRATRQTELTDSYPAHVVCKWLGNSELIAMGHYLQTTDTHFERAAAIPEELRRVVRAAATPLPPTEKKVEPKSDDASRPSDGGRLAISVSANEMVDSDCEMLATTKSDAKCLAVPAGTASQTEAPQNFDDRVSSYTTRTNEKMPAVAGIFVTTNVGVTGTEHPRISADFPDSGMDAVRLPVQLNRLPPGTRRFLEWTSRPFARANRAAHSCCLRDERRLDLSAGR